MAGLEARKLEMEQVVPNFGLPSLDGRRVSPRDYKQQRNLVLVYLDMDRCGGCGDLLREFADNYIAYQDLDTEILAISPQSQSELLSRIGTMGLPFPVLADEQGEVSQAYLGSRPGSGPIGGVFITDRFGALRSKLIVENEGSLPNQASILDWLGLIEMECPECGGAEPGEWGK